MKKSIAIAVVSCIALSANGQKTNKMELKTEKDSVSYSLGVNIAGNLMNQGFEDIDLNIMMEAMQDIYAKRTGKMSPEQAQGYLQNYMASLQQRINEKYLKEGQEFLAANAKKQGIQITASGLQYEVIKMGTGPKPSATSVVNTHYHGTLIDGTVFDSSVERGAPISFGLNQVIKGWTEGLQLMPEGSKFRFYIPQELAYGARPQPGGKIKPYMALIFDVELIKIEKP
jgi:FKBP-type peptidyl-prolyl cis-trans isomerase FklB